MCCPPTTQGERNIWFLKMGRSGSYIDMNTDLMRPRLRGRSFSTQ